MALFQALGAHAMPTTEAAVIQLEVQLTNLVFLVGVFLVLVVYTGFYEFIYKSKDCVDVQTELQKPRQTTKTALAYAAVAAGFNHSAILTPILTICSRQSGWEIGIRFAAQCRVPLQTMSRLIFWGSTAAVNHRTTVNRWERRNKIARTVETNNVGRRVQKSNTMA